MMCTDPAVVGGGVYVIINNNKKNSMLLKASAAPWDTPQLSVYGRLDKDGSIRLS